MDAPATSPVYSRVDADDRGPESDTRITSIRIEPAVGGWTVAISREPVKPGRNGMEYRPPENQVFTSMTEMLNCLDRELG